MKLPALSITVTNRTVIRTVVLVLVTMGLYLAVRSVGHILELVVIAAFLALAANPLTNLVQHKLRLSRLAGVTLTFIILVLFVGLFLVTVLPPLIKEIVAFVQNLPANVNMLQNGNDWASNLLRQYHAQDQLKEFISNTAANTQQYSTLVLDTLTTIGKSVAELFAVLVMIFMMLLEGPYWIKRFWSIQSQQAQDRYMPVAKHMYEIVTAYVNGQIVISIIGGLVVLIPLLLLKVPNAVALASIVAITGLIPLIGHPLGAAVVVLATLIDSLPKAVIMLVFFIVYLQIENISLQPYIQSKQNELSALTVFIAALVGIEFGGIIGAFLMIPLVACLRILVRDYLRHTHVKLET